jgi:hypothetical protein
MLAMTWWRIDSSFVKRELMKLTFNGPDTVSIYPDELTATPPMMDGAQIKARVQVDPNIPSSLEVGSLSYPGEPRHSR